MKKLEYIGCLSTPAQIEDWVKGRFIKGHSEPRVGLVGRSNVGKSSLLNRLAGQNVAHVSKTPGKTKQIHLFKDSNWDWIWADLPGYGFAKVEHAEQKRWEAMTRAYLEHDEALFVLLLLWDARNGPTDSDIEALKYFMSLGLTCLPVMTKFDELKKQADRSRRMKEVAAVLERFPNLPTDIIWTSSQKSQGIDQLLKRIQERCDSE